jgi:hypothetical protein
VGLAQNLGFCQVRARLAGAGGGVGLFRKNVRIYQVGGWRGRWVVRGGVGFCEKCQWFVKSAGGGGAILLKKI